MATRQSQTDFNILYLLNKTKYQYKGLYELEIHCIMYMILLINLFKNKLISNKSYNFIIKDRRPFSAEVNISLSNLVKIGFINNTKNKYIISEEGLDFLESIECFYSYKDDIENIDIIIYCLQSSSIVSLSYNMENETLVNDINKNNNRYNRFIIDKESSSIELIYNDFKTLNSVFKDKNIDCDIITMVSIWIQYIIETSEDATNVN